MTFNQKFESHDSYEIVAKVSGEKIIYDSDDDQSEKIRFKLFDKGILDCSW